MKLKLLLLLPFLIFSPKIEAQELKAKFQDWNFFETNRGDKVVCYLASVPIKRAGNYFKRGESFFLVTDIANDADEVSVSSGFIYNQDSDVELSFGSKRFYLFPYRALAWANDKNEDIDIIKIMQKEGEMIVTGVVENGKIAIDTYSLIGFKEAYGEMKRKCKNNSDE